MKKRRIKSYITLFTIGVLILIIASACSSKKEAVEPTSRTEFVLGTICTVKVYDKYTEKDLDKVFDRLKQIEARMTINKEGSELDAVADAAGKSPVKVSDDTFFVVQKGIEYAKQSGGVFDITVGPLVKLWGIGTNYAKLPSQQEIDEEKALINYKDIVMDEKNKTIMLKKQGMIIDVGGIAKGYAADEAVKVLKEDGVKHAIVNLGGNVFVMNSNIKGEAWKVGIQNPYEPRGKSIGFVCVVNKTVVTSGIYERYFEKDGKKYHHILNTKTGYPMDNSLASVTVIRDVSVDADAMTKAVFYKDVDEGLKSVESLKGVEAIFITKDKKVYITPGLKDNFKITNSEFKLMN
ncbi:MAG: FAD:protein FMN transferase [Clostridiaceae bacterium]|nr:FAD:protein FMN transferase [Clostridiaceae bacterium]